MRTSAAKTLTIRCIAVVPDNQDCPDGDLETSTYIQAQQPAAYRQCIGGSRRQAGSAMHLPVQLIRFGGRTVVRRRAAAPSQ